METKQGHDAGYVLGHSEKELERLIAQARRYEPFTTQLFRDAGIAPGMRVLDVGSGSGDVAFLVARLVGPNGQVVGVDQSATAVATAGRRAGELGFPNARFLVGDAGEMAFEELFDAAVGRFVLEFSRDPSVLLRAIAAHVRGVAWSPSRKSIGPGIARSHRCPPSPAAYAGASKRCNDRARTPMWV